MPTKTKSASQPAQPAPVVPAARADFAAADAHKLMLSGMDRRIARSRAAAKEEAERAIRRLQRLVEALDAGQQPTSFDGAPDMSALSRELTELGTTMQLRNDAQGWIDCINA